MTVTQYASTPIPAGRGRWRLFAYNRQFSTALPTALGDLANARGRRIEQKWNTATQMTFTIDGHDPAAATVLELATDVVALRWNETAGTDIAMFRGLVDHSEDQLSEQSATVTFVAHDYFAMYSRRFFTGPGTGGWANMDQDDMVSNLIWYASYITSGDGNTSFMPGSSLPLVMARVNPDGSNRASKSGQLRTRTWAPQTTFAEAISNLATVINGFDFDVLAMGPSSAQDRLRVFYPQQGVTRSDMVLEYGGNVTSVTRTVSSADYANYVRVVGNNATTDPAAAQLYADRWNTDSNNITVTPVGLWMLGENASDVSVQATLNDKAAGDLGYAGILTPSYTLKLRPDTYRLGYPNMGDVVPIVIRAGRLNVNTTARVIGITYDIGDDGQEDVELTVGRPPPSLAKMLRDADRNIDALARR